MQLFPLYISARFQKCRNLDSVQLQQSSTHQSTHKVSYRYRSYSSHFTEHVFLGKIIYPFPIVFQNTHAGKTVHSSLPKSVRIEDLDPSLVDQPKCLDPGYTGRPEKRDGCDPATALSRFGAESLAHEVSNVSVCDGFS